MKCLLKYQWVKLPRNQLPPGKGANAMRGAGRGRLRRRKHERFGSRAVQLSALALSAAAVVTVAAAIADGVITYHCAGNASHTKTEAIPATGHAYGAWTSDGGMNHAKSCPKPGCPAPTIFEMHSFTDTVIAATCTEAGYSIHSCTVCAYSYQDAQTDATGHNYTWQIIAINFEDIDYEHLTGYRALYDYIKGLLLPDRMNYIFLDEIRHVEQFEKAVDSLFIKENCDVYITGSNAYFMSGELATLLSGRYVELKMLPLSFREFCSGLHADAAQTNAQRFDAYMRMSSFPYAMRLPSTGREAQEYLTDLYHTVLLKDVVARRRIADVTGLERVTRFLLHNIGSRVSAGKIANTLKSAGKGVDQKTVDKYMRGLTDSLLLYEATRYHIKGKQYLSTQSKYYVVDVALRNTLVKGAASDIGHILENVVVIILVGEKAVGVTSSLLGGIHGRVGALNQLLISSGIMGVLNDAHATGHRQLLLSIFVVSYSSP